MVVKVEVVVVVVLVVDEPVEVDDAVVEDDSTVVFIVVVVEVKISGSVLEQPPSQKANNQDTITKQIPITKTQNILFITKARLLVARYHRR